ncbi:competence type IV pilus minor pilin ComGG [Streptococcus suis]|uniref:competence type IV pilus minor pilin ComGG n=1 Tax=Streptococcus suis TaxID=1307 RepID=UPI0014790C31
MILKKKVKAGILLYALLMLAVFVLLLQFYLNQQVSEGQLIGASRESTQAYLIAQMTKDQVVEEVSRLAKEEATKESQEKFLAEKAEQARKEQEEKKGETSEESVTPQTKERPSESGQESVSAEDMERSNNETAQTSQKEEVKKESKPKSIETSGQLSFVQGQAQYQVKKEKLTVTIQLSSGQTYQYQFMMKKEKERVEES